MAPSYHDKHALSGGFNGKSAPKSSWRYSTGPLYSARELKKTEAFLAAEGFVQTKDEIKLGLRIYARPGDEKSSAVIYLDALNCHPDNSGTMIISDGDKGTRITTVWEFAKEHEIAAAKNPISRFFKKLF